MVQVILCGALDTTHRVTKSTKTVDKQASGPHTYALDREIKSPVQKALS